MQQLVGLRCINCQRTVDSIVEGRFCVGCQAPVHKDCIVPPDEANASGRCRICGANLSQAAELAQIERETRPEPPAGLPAITINGIGVSYCFARGAGDVGGDALQCFVVMFMPLAAMKAVHLFNETHGFGTRGYRSIPLKWSNNLVWRVYCLYWMAIPFVAGTITALIATMVGAANGFGRTHLLLAIGGLIPAIACGYGYYLLWHTDRRTRQIRKLLGRHEYGTSDPAMWADELVAGLRSPVHMFETESFAAAVPMLLEKGERGRAMWAARLSVACEDAAKGELLTTTVLEAKAAATAT